MQTKGSRIEDALVLRPFPQADDASQLEALWEAYRREIVSRAGIAIFLFGNKEENGQITLSDGMIREFEIARNQGVLVLPIGATGSAAKVLADQVISDFDKFLPGLDAGDRKKLSELAKHTDDLGSLIAPIMELIRKLQGKA
jgi:hypothetical protein